MTGTNVLSIGPKSEKFAWVSENGVRFHIETTASAAENGAQWQALGGAVGECFFIHTVAAIRHEMRCQACQLASTQNILGVTPQGVAGVSGIADGREDRSPAGSALLSGMGIETPNPYPGQYAVARSEKLPSEYRTSPADSKVLDGTTIERLISTVVRVEEKQ